MKDNNDDNLKKELLELEKRYWTALRDRDVETVQTLSADECIVTGAQGVGAMTKESVAGMVEKATYEVRDFKIEDVKMQRLADDVAVLAYKVHEDLVVDGAPVSLDAADASTWVRKNGSWVCALHTESLLGDPFGRDRGTRVDAPN
jgi:hypothetical protein